MAPLALFTLWRYPQRGSQCKNVAPLALKNAYLWLCLKSHIFWSNLLAWGYRHTLPLYHAFVIDMVLANEAEIPAPSEVSMFALGGDGDFSSTAGPQASGPRPSAKMSESRCLLQQTASSKQSLRMVGGAKFRSKEQSDVARK